MMMELMGAGVTLLYRTLSFLSSFTPCMSHLMALTSFRRLPTVTQWSGIFYE